MIISDDERSFTLSLKYVDASQIPGVAHIEVKQCGEENIQYYMPADACSDERFSNISTLLKYHQG